MLFVGSTINAFWDSIHEWLAEIKVMQYQWNALFSGDLENSDMFSYIILICKMTIYNAMKAGKIPHLQQVLSNVKNIYYAERYKAYIKRQQTLFDKNGQL